MVYKSLKIAKAFETFAQTVQMQPGDLQKVLEDAGLWGGTDGQFNTQNKVANNIFGILDKYAPPTGSFKIDSVIYISPGLDVKIIAQAPKHSKQISQELNQLFASKMSKALKQHVQNTKQLPPSERVTLPWLNQVGY